jgi:ribosomal-protein-alanine N-acetyltransferase
MLIIEALTTELAVRTTTIQAVAAIEALIQPHDAWTYQALIDLLAQNSMKLITATHPINGDILGYCLYQVVFEQAEILRIGTHPKHQRQGIASQLFVTLNEELQVCDVDSLLLEVRADNSSAIALYEQQEFTIIHRRKGYYQLPHQPAIDALIMQRKF